MISTGLLRNIHFTTTLQQKLYSIIFNIIGLHWNVDNVGKRLISHFLDFLYNLTYAQFLGGGCPPTGNFFKGLSTWLNV